MKKLTIIVIILLVAITAYYLYPHIAYAAPTVTISPVASDTSTNVDYCFGWSSEDFDVADDNWVIGFFEDDADADKSFDISGITVSDTEANTEVYVYFDSDDCGTTQGAGYQSRPSEGIEAGIDTLEDRDLVVGVDNPDDDYVFILIDIDDDAVISDGTDISIGFVTKAGNTILTPTDPGNYKVITQQYVIDSNPIEVEWWDVQLLYIGGANETDISASVDPTLTFDIVEIASDTATTSCDLGELLDFSISTCSYRTKISTNGPNGYTLYVKEVAQLQNADGDLIGYSDGTINEGVSEYGIATTDLFTGQGIDQLDDADGNLTVETADCTYTGVPANDVTSGTFTALSSSAESFASSDVAVTDEYTTMCYGASISDATEGGVYTQDIILTVVGNF